MTAAGNRIVFIWEELVLRWDINGVMVLNRVKDLCLKSGQFFFGNLFINFSISTATNIKAEQAPTIKNSVIDKASVLKID